ncbi:hypothetical protein X734_18900 [Mesorhizobium sp. L2C084A000]|nr:hypothetical protein X734_18900 [Mesorhizobium sp. L2C084A000]
MGHLVKTEEGEDREHDNDKADKIDNTVHVHVLRGSQLRGTSDVPLGEAFIAKLKMESSSGTHQHE